jgi:hypothetical protein
MYPFTTVFRPTLGPIQPPIQWVPGALSLGGFKQWGHQADHSPPSSAEVKKGAAIPPLPHMPSWHTAYLIKHRDSFTLPLPRKKFCLKLEAHKIYKYYIPQYNFIHQIEVRKLKFA